MKTAIAALFLFGAGNALAEEVELICEYTENGTVETRAIRFDEAAGTLTYKGGSMVDDNKHNEHSADGGTRPVTVEFSATAIKMQFYICLTSLGSSGTWCTKNLRTYTLDRVAGTLTAEKFEHGLTRFPASFMQCRRVESSPKF